MIDDRLELQARSPARRPPSSIVQTRLGAIEYASYGDGLPVLALHGGMGGYDQSLLLADSAIGIDGFRVVAVSRPGYLRTPPADLRSPPMQADLCAALLDALGIERAAVIAVSAGGPCALHLALRHPDRCAGLVMVSACTGRLAMPPELSRRIAVMRVLARIPFLLAMMRRRVMRNPDAAARRAIPDPDLRARTLRHAQGGPLMTELLTSTLDRLGQRLPGTLNDIAQFQTVETFPFVRIAAPVLVIYGTADRAVPFAHAEILAATAPRAKLFSVAGGEHVTLFTHLDEVRARVATFLADV